LRLINGSPDGDRKDIDPYNHSLTATGIDAKALTIEARLVDDPTGRVLDIKGRVLPDQQIRLLLILAL
jgi:hypothetical protein